ncbi:MAG: hypothetical protein KKC71_08530 [Chloroflexi bacterium]|nr:hypothetical protein [Chloroflexota bacterium]
MDIIAQLDLSKIYKRYASQDGEAIVPERHTRLLEELGALEADLARRRELLGVPGE